MFCRLSIVLCVSFIRRRKKISCIIDKLKLYNRSPNWIFVVVQEWNGFSILSVGSNNIAFGESDVYV